MRPAISQLPPALRLAADVLKLIGNTPLVPLRRLPSPEGARVLAKMESCNPGGSVKDRIALAMIEDAESRRVLKPGATIVEPTSGNTGIGLALVAAVRGYKLLLTMPEDMSTERRKLLERYGAKLFLTPTLEGMAGAVEAAQRLLREYPGAFMPQQFENPANPEIHRRTTALEILRDTEGAVDAFVAGVGTGGTITGVGEVLKKHNPNVLVVAVEPARSPLLSKGKAAIHGIPGIGANFIPRVLNRQIIDKIVTVEDDAAYEMAQRLAQQEGLFVGPSAGANVVASLEVARRLGAGKCVVTVLPDTGERYLSLEF
ncbi:MAG: cysteine synthase A [Dehalococcoidia bacterium]|nr:cysteine synthase A [Dehalococcoidia bacterium]